MTILPLIYKPCAIPLTLKDRQPVNVQGKNYEVNLHEIIEVPGCNSVEVTKETQKRRITLAPTMAKRAYEEGISIIKAVLENSLIIGGVEFIKFPAGRFVMGSKDDNPPTHEIHLRESFN